MIKALRTFLLLPVLMFIDPIEAIGQCDERDPDMAKYKAKMSKDAQGCSQCAMLAMYHCWARYCSPDSIDKKRKLLSMISACKRNIAVMAEDSKGYSCCPELTNKQPQWHVNYVATQNDETKLNAGGDPNKSNKDLDYLKKGLIVAQSAKTLRDTSATEGEKAVAALSLGATLLHTIDEKSEIANALYKGAQVGTMINFLAGLARNVNQKSASEELRDAQRAQEKQKEWEAENKRRSEEQKRKRAEELAIEDNKRKEYQLEMERLDVIEKTGDLENLVTEIDKIISIKAAEGNLTEVYRLHYRLARAYTNKNEMAMAIDEINKAKVKNFDQLSPGEKKSVKRVETGDSTEVPNVQPVYFHNINVFAVEMANIYMHFQQNEKALAAIKEVLPALRTFKKGVKTIDFKYKDFMQVYFLRAVVYSRKGEYQQALEIVEQLIKQRKSYFDPNIDLSQADLQIFKINNHLLMGNPDGAWPDLEFMMKRNVYYIPLFQSLREYAVQKKNTNMVMVAENKIYKLSDKTWTAADEILFKTSINLN